MPAAPGAGVQGSVPLTPNLGSAVGSYCDPTSYVAAGNAALGYLLERWNDATNPDGDANAAYDDKPGGRAAYGRYAQPRNFIFYREKGRLRPARGPEELRVRTRTCSARRTT